MADPSRERFANEVIDLVGRRFPLVKIARAEQPFSMSVNGNVASLENLYRIANLRPQDTQRQVARWIVELLRAAEGAPDLDGSFELLKHRILPMVVPDNGDRHRLAVCQPLIDGLAVAYGLDNDRTIAYVTTPRLHKWGVDIEALHETAMDNLLQRSETINASAAQNDSGDIYLIIFQTLDGYDASRILLPNLHEKLREHLGSPFAAAIPNRDILLCFRNDEDTVEKLRPQIHSAFHQMPHDLTDRLMLITADGIAPRGE
jgi:hypothetical protein